ncbi:sensor histidine kinase [Parablautia sp. Marseille-Q6255]|uniref:sensor histidine kinase n=1 Tax=Parablautia sp. Marseille-Q6255 TaxID=3039593 RepID=UPI0024BC5AFE|nr:HAMP domain-containing sensor histidine kinase [Parablautia sp. Marseille-Q6255]
MSEKFKLVSQKLGVKLLAVAAFAFILAWLGHYLVSDVAAEWFFYNPKFDTYWETKSYVAVQDFQKYVTERNLSMQEALTDTVWNKQNANIILFTEPAYSYEEKKASSAFEDEDTYEVIYCSDGFIYATSYLPGDFYFFGWNMIGLCVGVFLFLGIVMPFNAYTIHRINKLYQQVLLSSQSGRNNCIEISGKDEIAKLGNEIETMRISLLSLLENEEKMRSESEQMVASLSHDLRTPLTKLTGYLEILIHKKNLTEFEHERYLTKAVEKAQQMKLLTDELFQNFVAGTENKSDYLKELIDGGEFLNQVLYEECSELETDGFLVNHLPVFCSGYFCCLHIGDIRRAFDNIFSNLQKYADPKIPIKITEAKQHDKIGVIIENSKRKHPLNFASHKIGLMTVATLVEQNGGTVNIKQDSTTFSIEIFLPIMPASECDKLPQSYLL